MQASSHMANFHESHRMVLSTRTGHKLYIHYEPKGKEDLNMTLKIGIPKSWRTGPMDKVPPWVLSTLFDVHPSQKAAARHPHGSRIMFL